MPRRMRIMTEPGEWVGLAFGYDKDSVQVVAHAELARNTCGEGE